MEKPKNELFAKTFLLCANMILKEKFMVQEPNDITDNINDRINTLFIEIGCINKSLYNYIHFGLDMLTYSLTPNYIHVAMEHRVYDFFTAELTNKEIMMSAILFKNLLVNSIIPNDLDYLRNIYQGECIYWDLSEIKIPMHKLFHGFLEKEEMFRPVWMPENYIMSETEELRKLKYVNTENHQTILFYQRLAGGDTSANKDVIFQEKHKIAFKNKQLLEIDWSQDFNGNLYFFNLVTSGISLDELLKISENIVAVPFKNTK